jgi:hypothetical protein
MMLVGELWIQEYIVWQVFDHRIDWFYIEADRYAELEPGGDGLLRSRVFPGLWLDRSAMLAGNLAQVLGVVQQGIQSPEHQAFIDQLNSTQSA